MITEDGTGLSNANSYASNTATTVYSTDRGYQDWLDATVGAQSRALIIATDFIEGHYRALGEPLSLSQGLQWPRIGDYGVNPLIVRATMILALEALKGPLVAVRADRGIKQLEETGEGVGSIKTVYDDVADTDPFPGITAMLSGIATLRTGGGGVWFGRVVR